MKRSLSTTVLLTAILLTFPMGIHAQETETLFSGEISHGGYGGLVYGGTSINGQFAYLRGFRGAWVVNFADEHAVNVGIASYETDTNFDAADWPHQDIEEPQMNTDYDGFELEYVNRTNKLFHWSVQAMVGSGDVQYGDENPALETTSDRYFVVQPGVNINMNITEWFRISGAVTYRLASGVNLDGTSGSELSGVASFVTLRFGWF